MATFVDGAAFQDWDFRSRQCRHGEHATCDGYFGTDGNSLAGNDTFTCLCDCSGHPLVREDS